ncbi:hypothetical protein UA08_02255 [Talaromyces atroroseus]|uniref:Uncharacterized protein n=1 Tax=Talaromyces atroroseus TaxID=1441469 RepID=A0A225B7X0_TALAT|nr:hypothetical protein UA08_02255 [Talaromyces atroroseus]OKL62027.1 hypothetical protein UA08_02255 [Talaromyces atroroseus]
MRWSFTISIYITLHASHSQQYHSITVFSIDILQMAVDVDHLFGLSPNIPQYAYKNKRTFLAVRDEATLLFKSKKNQSQYIVFSGVTKDIYYHDLDEELGIDSFIPNLEIILYKMPTRTHEAIQREFATMLDEKLMHMGRLHKAILRIGEADVEGEGRTKRPDTSYLPIRYPNRKWPTLVVEVGFSQDLRKLQTDARWWLSESNGDVRTMIIISKNPKKNEMTIEKWIFDQGPTREYHTMVVKDVNGAKATNQNPLIIGFNDLLLRDPQEPLEQDINFPGGDWEEYADRVWAWQYAEE